MKIGALDFCAGRSSPSLVGSARAVPLRTTCSPEVTLEPSRVASVAEAEAYCPLADWAFAAAPALICAATCDAETGDMTRDTRPGALTACGPLVRALGAATAMPCEGEWMGSGHDGDGVVA